MRTSATFQIKSWEEEPFGEQADGPRLTRAHIQKTFHGDLTGTGELVYVMMHFENGLATFEGLEKIVGNLGGRSGSFVLQHSGSYDGEIASGRYSVVRGSGTNALTGLSGTGGFAAGDAAEHEMTLEYDL